MLGKLIGIGLGPGDPELMTMKAHRLISSADVVAYPSLEGADSFARSIASTCIKDSATEIVIGLPMTVAREPAQAAYDKGADRIAEVLATGQDVVFLCEGDPLFYGSFMYLQARLSDRFATEIVPGITSVSASSATLARPLVARNETLSVIPAPLAEDELEARIRAADAVVMMKVGRHMAKVRRVLDRLNLTDQATYVERASLADEVVLPLAEAPLNAPYFSLVLLTKGRDAWL